MSAKLSILVIAFAMAGRVIAAEPIEFIAELQLYRVMTNISGDAAQTLPCSTPDIVHTIDERLDDVVLHMDGPTLTWNGQEMPRHPLLIQDNRAYVNIVKEGVPAKASSTAHAEYFERADDQWKLSVLDYVKETLHFEIQRDPAAPGVLIYTYDFAFSYIQERTKIPEAQTLDVGKPVLGSVVSRGEWRLRDNEWSCLRVQVPSQGRLYVFLRIRAPKPAGQEVGRGGAAVSKATRGPGA